ncbi:terminase large subunit [Tranquillimonas alkanivorans]|uniref:Phage terminase-like protein, large subunit, contains N-terminal HTH domain n=1 Tax=Tranquillimonas alkanivorans TaxID=441119 RepID=A0A1I5RVI4_9RHOB|nr:terminase TerL endonuclease subunit [Tranquillimonas alkanivorans]SFP62599.1 Phage terminase-like protein, large subunit, contains N-terminal HTH domain [Tranquillimonas alkanivorans]
MLVPDWIHEDVEIADPMGHGDRAVQWLRKLKHPKNPAPGHPFQLDPWQEKIVRRVYGPRNEDGSRVVRRVVLLLPRGNRKTSLASALTLLHLVGPEKKPGGLIVSAASAHEQAMELFNETALIVDNDSRLRKHLSVREYTSRITFKRDRTRYVALHADGKTQHGKTPDVVIADELHAWEGRKGRSQWEALDSALVKVPGTLMIVASTSGRGQENLAWQTVEYAMKVQKGEIEDPATLPVIFMAEPEDDWTDETVWRAVNPGLDHGYPDIGGFRDKARKAEHSPFERDSFLQFNLNRWLDQSTSPFVEMHVYDKGAHEVDLDELEMVQAPCWLGVDLSKNEDLTCVVACWENGDDGYQVHPWFFCPEDNLRARGDRHGVDYVSWAEDGYIIPTPGNVVDFRFIEEHIRELFARFNVREAAFDPHMGRVMMQNLEEDGLPVVEMRQGWVTMAPAVKELERAILARRFNHGGHPVLRWNFDNVQLHVDAAGNRSFHKGKSGNKIDGAVATAMAVARCAAGETQFITSADWFEDDFFLA